MELFPLNQIIFDCCLCGFPHWRQFLWIISLRLLQMMFSHIILKGTYFWCFQSVYFCVSCPISLINSPCMCLVDSHCFEMTDWLITAYLPFLSLQYFLVGCARPPFSKHWICVFVCVKHLSSSTFGRQNIFLDLCTVSHKWPSGSVYRTEAPSPSSFGFLFLNTLCPQSIQLLLTQNRRRVVPTHSSRCCSYSM